METVVFIKSLGLSLISLVEIQHGPFLVVSSVVTPYTNSMSFFVLVTFNFKDLAVLPVDKLFILILEHLPPT